MEQGADYQRCLERLIWAIDQLDGKIDTKRLETIAEVIIRTMTGPWRYFHTPEHIFEVGGVFEPDQLGNPIEILAALFHDLVYVQVDQNISLNISSYIVPYIKDVQGHLAIRPLEELPDSLMFRIVTAIFGFNVGQTLSPFGGQNEFLSALIAAVSLEHALKPSIIAQISACIEATIPFRPKTPAGLEPGELLLQRLRQASLEFDFGWTEDQLVEITKQAVRLANRDVENFAAPNSAHFLDNTWNLLPETNHELSNINSYTVAGYRKSLQKMEGFMSYLKPEVVFQQFRGEPDDHRFQQLIDRTRHNLEVAKLYLGVKLFTIAVIEALSYRLGRDIPLSTMMGELPTKGITVSALEHFLPDMAPIYPPQTSTEKEVFEILDKGRTRDSYYDIKNSPVATFIVKSIGFSSMDYHKERSKEFFTGQVSAVDFLRECDSRVVNTLTEGVVKLFDSRKAALLGQKEKAPA